MSINFAYNFILTGSLDSSDTVRTGVVRTAASVGETLSHCKYLIWRLSYQDEENEFFDSKFPSSPSMFVEGLLFHHLSIYHVDPPQPLYPSILKYVQISPISNGYDHSPMVLEKERIYYGTNISFMCTRELPILQASLSGPGVISNTFLFCRSAIVWFAAGSSLFCIFLFTWHRVYIHDRKCIVHYLIQRQKCC